MILEIASPTIVAEDAHLQGEFVFSSPVQIYGLVEGKIEQQSHEGFLLGNSGWVRGDISTRGVAVIAGRVDGNVRSQTKIELLAGASVHGTLEAPQLIIRPGGHLNGGVVMQRGQDIPPALRLAA